jgi:hypothetical protein
MLFHCYWNCAPICNLKDVKTDYHENKRSYERPDHRSYSIGNRGGGIVQEMCVCHHVMSQVWPVFKLYYWQHLGTQCYTEETHEIPPLVWFRINHFFGLLAWPEQLHFHSLWTTYRVWQRESQSPQHAKVGCHELVWRHMSGSSSPSPLDISHREKSCVKKTVLEQHSNWDTLFLSGGGGLVNSMRDFSDGSISTTSSE